MYKLIAIDLDGTLLDSQGEVSQENKEAIEAAQKQGIEVVITSGRVSDSARKIAEEVNANNYLIAGNGTIIMDLKNNEIIYESFISKDKALKIIKICEENSVFYNVYTQKGIITKSLNYNVQSYHYENSKKTEEMRTNINVVEDIYKYIEEINSSPISKISICDENKIIFNGIINKLKQIEEIELLEVEHMAKKVIKSGTESIGLQYYYAEMTNVNANKWDAIKRLATKLEIKVEEIVTIGDNMNDEKMITNAGLGISMGDSALSEKCIGKLVTKNNDNNGVAYAINQYVIVK